VPDVFGSAHRGEGHAYYQRVRETGHRLAEAGFTVMTGGGPGLMEAANRGAHEAGRKSVGRNVMLPWEERPNPYVDDTVDFAHLFIRKEMLIRFSYGFIAGPGGLGTFDEVFEAATLVHTGKIRNFPLVLLGRAFWEPVVAFLASEARQGAMVDSTTEHFFLTDSPTDAVEHIRTSGGGSVPLGYSRPRWPVLR
jgi:uncharacterized protein (TIGR00730 family)